MKSPNWTAATTYEQHEMKVPQAWAQLECASCGRPVGPEAAGSMECLVCTVRG